ncbi:TPA: hypothetical protein P6V06_002591 [Staphylococcus aureus]|nr:hypothetical protein [Staphylococcus aureus]
MKKAKKIGEMYTQPNVYIINLAFHNMFFIQGMIGFKDAAHQHFHRGFLKLNIEK